MRCGESTYRCSRLLTRATLDSPFKHMTRNLGKLIDTGYSISKLNSTGTNSTTDDRSSTPSTMTTTLKVVDRFDDYTHFII